MKDENRPALPLPGATLVAFTVALLAVLLIALFSYNALEAGSRAAGKVTQTLRTLQELKAFVATLLDAETGQRGYLLTGDEAYLQPYLRAKTSLASDLEKLRQIAPEQRPRIDTLAQLAAQEMEVVDRTVALRRQGDEAGALALLRTDRGKVAMDRVRELVIEVERDEEATLAGRQAQWRDTATTSTFMALGGSALLLVLIAAAIAAALRLHRAERARVWLEAGQVRLSTRMGGEQDVASLGTKVLEFLAQYLGASVGALHMAEGDTSLRRIAGYAMAKGERAGVTAPGEGLVGQAARENRSLYEADVPASYLDVNSSLGQHPPRTLLVAPASADGEVQGVLELGFLRPLHEAERELLARVSQSLGVALRSAKEHLRREVLLQQTQSLAEELQTQQEELRVSNEELEEQGRVLRESQSRLEAQQAELEHTNNRLEEQSEVLRDQKAVLSQAQATLSEKAEELARSNRYKSEFLANMSHELRTPLNSSLILSKLLADNPQGNLSDEQVKFAQTISAAGNDLLALINDILDLSKIEAGKIDVSFEPVPVRRALDALARGIEPMAAQRGLAFTTAIDADVPETLETDPQRLAQILKNLLSNAVKFTERGEVALRVSTASGGRVAFAVRDTGIGIPEEQQGIVFEAFRQADGSTHRQYGGTGLGLSISRDLARLLGGGLEMKSVAGEGSTFTLTLPLVRAAAGPRAGEADAAPPSAPADVPKAVPKAVSKPVAADPVADDRDHLVAGTRLILVIEDDTRFAAILRDLVQEMGFQCVVAHTAADGLASARAHRPSAIVLDINLPDMSGLAVLDRLKGDPHTRHIPVHVASVAEHGHAVLERGAIGYALKPVAREELVRALRRLEAKFTQAIKRVLVVEDDARQLDSIRLLLDHGDVEITGVATASQALTRLAEVSFDCMVMDLNLPDLSGLDLLETMAARDDVAFPPVIVYTGRDLGRDEELRLRRYSRSIIVKDARSPERLLDEVTLFLHQVESSLPPERQRMIATARSREAGFEGRRILVVEDDVRNIFALSSVLEPRGAKVEIARNGRQAIQALERATATPGQAIDLVLMDIMMPEMDGLTTMREIRQRDEWKRLPIIALTAKAMRNDQEECIAAGADDYIAKPLDVDKLLSLVRVWLPKERARGVS